MITFRPHDSSQSDHPTDESGRTYTTIDLDTAEKYVQVARSEGQDLFITAGSGVSDSEKLDMLVTETDSIGLEMPTKQYAPGY